LNVCILVEYSVRTVWSLLLPDDNPGSIQVDVLFKMKHSQTTL